MVQKGAVRNILGLDLGTVNTRASLFGVRDDQYSLLGSVGSPTTVGPQLNLSIGVEAALTKLQKTTQRKFLDSETLLRNVPSDLEECVDRVVIAASVGPHLRTAIVGLTPAGSVAAANALVDSLPLDLVSMLTADDLVDESVMVNTLVLSRPEVILLSGGEDRGAHEANYPLIEVVRQACLLLPRSIQPAVYFTGNPLVEDRVRRRLEPLVRLYTIPNIQPTMDDYDLLPAQAFLNDAVIESWEKKVKGFRQLNALAAGNATTKAFGLGRMVRFLSRINTESPSGAVRGVLAVDLGGESTTVAAGYAGQVQFINYPFRTQAGFLDERAVQKIQNNLPLSLDVQQIKEYYNDRLLYPTLVPTNAFERALDQSIARLRLEEALAKLRNTYPALADHSWEKGGPNFEPIIASGAALTQAPTFGQCLLMLLDGLEPRGITTLVLDRNHLLPLLGVLGEILPILPIQILESGIFTHLATVINPISRIPYGKKILEIQMRTSSGGDITQEIKQGSLTQLPLACDETAVIILKPTSNTDVGFGGEGIGGRLKVIGGELGVVVDARGRPIQFLADDVARQDQVNDWLESSSS